MSDTDDLTVEVEGPNIIVRMPGTDHLAIYHKPNGAPQLRSKDQFGPIDFRVHAWTLANDTAKELGWLEVNKA
jgi:hypothetical protein